MYDTSVLYEHLMHISVNKALLTVGFATFCIYLFLVRLRRWKRYNVIHQQYGAKWNDGKGTISPAEAQIIMQTFMDYDLAILLDLGLTFAMFKIYAIVSSCCELVFQC